MMFILVHSKFDFGPMAKFEKLASEKEAEAENDEKRGRGTVFDLIFPIVSLIVLCTIGMIYTGGFFESGENH